MPTLENKPSTLSMWASIFSGLEKVLTVFLMLLVEAARNKQKVAEDKLAYREMLDRVKDKHAEITKDAEKKSPKQIIREFLDTGK
jgi:hypothetical protein